jgi:aryl-alcohol dehydrogenase-like predicted oxidoreductase
MKYDKIEGLDKDISKLIMGNDNQTYFDEAAKLWDHWMEVGGNAFDTAHIYGGGSMEKLLGEWHRKRNNLKDLGNCCEKVLTHLIVIQKVSHLN